MKMNPVLLIGNRRIDVRLWFSVYVDEYVVIHVGRGNYEISPEYFIMTERKKILSDGITSKGHRSQFEQPPSGQVRQFEQKDK